MCKRVTAHHMRTIYLEQCGITMGFDPIRSTRSRRKDGMTGMTRRRGRPCAWPPVRGVCGVPPPLKPPFEIGDPLEVMNSMYTDRNKTEVRRTVAPRTTCGRPREFLANRNVTHISCEPTPIYVDAAWSRERAAGAQVGAPTAFDQERRTTIRQ